MSLRHRHKRREEEKYSVWDNLKDKNLGRHRRLRGGWTAEQAVDLEALHGMDVEEELTKALTFDILSNL